jgi:hypothetical protein
MFISGVRSRCRRKASGLYIKVGSKWKLFTSRIGLERLYFYMTCGSNKTQSKSQEAGLARQNKHCSEMGNVLVASKYQFNWLS